MYLKKQQKYGFASASKRRRHPFAMAHIKHSRKNHYRTFVIVAVHELLRAVDFTYSPIT